MQPQPFVSTDKVRSVYLPVAQAMRELSDRLLAFCSETDQERLYTLSADLKGVGWNSLFVGSSIDRFLQLTIVKRNTAKDTAEKEVSRQLDSLLVAASYLERSVKNLKAVELETTKQSKDRQDACACFADKLGEIIRECHRSTK